MSFRKIRGNIRIHHNMLISSRDRHPTLGGHLPPESDADSIFDFRNNVIYNREGTRLQQGRHTQPRHRSLQPRRQLRGPGPNTDFNRDFFPIAPNAEAQNVTTSFLNANDPTDHNATQNDGYTNLGHYRNSLVD
ncbi:MAG: hypothetical protein JNM99_23075 [Verrucomicrobiaceae bacterium]|nr:hypothetical protein [Verrucomicrobiaceae bacterium]